DGTFFLGSTAGGTYSVTSLGVGAGGIYRLGGGGNTLTITSNVLAANTSLQVGVPLANGTGALSNGGGTVAFNVAQGTAGTYAGAVAITSATLTLLNNNGTANNNATTAQTQTLTGDVTLNGSATLNAGPSGQTFSSVLVALAGKLNYGGNVLTLGNGVVQLTGAAATGSGGTVLAGGVVLHVANMNQLAGGNLQLSSGAFVLGKDDGTGVAPSWTQFNARYSGGYGGGLNKWQITGSGGGFAGKGSPGDTVTLALDNVNNSAYGYVTSQTLFDRDFRLGAERRGNLTGVSGSQVFYANLPVVVAQNTVLSGIRNISVAPTGP